MKKQLLVISLGLLVSTSCLATGSLLPRFITEKLKSSKAVSKPTSTPDEYADLSGDWTGTCESDGYKYEEQFVLRMGDDGSSIYVNDERATIDAIAINESKTNLESEFSVLHFHWSRDGQQLLSSGLHYYQQGNLSGGGIASAATKSAYYLENGQLIAHHDVTDFTDGTLNSSVEAHCIYKKSDTK